MDNQLDAIIAETLRGLHMEINALRTANAGLVEKVKRLEAAGNAMAAYDPDTVFADDWNRVKGQP